MNADDILRDVYLPVRSDLLTIAAALDRVDAAENAAATTADHRDSSGIQPATNASARSKTIDDDTYEAASSQGSSAGEDAPSKRPGADDMRPVAMRSRIDAAIAVLVDGGPRRAERIQQLFSRPYDPGWTDRFGLKLADAPERR